MITVRRTRALPTLASVLLSLAACTAPPRALSIDVDDHAMRLFVAGEGRPTVVLEGGSGCTHATWSALQPRLAELARVVSYDRAGFGESAPCPRPRDARTVAEELHGALRAADLQPPWVLVGWSMGGLFVREFAALYPDEVAGLILLDPSPEDFYARAEREFPEAYAAAEAADDADMADGPPGEVAEIAEWDSSLAQVRAGTATLRAPVILLSAPRADLAPMHDIWHDEQRRWAARVGGEFRIVEGAGHAIHHDRPEVVIDVVRGMCQSVHAD